MKIGVFDPVFGAMALEPMLDRIAALGLEAVEIGAGNYPGDRHCRPAELLADDAAALDTLAASALVEAGDGRGGLRVDALVALPRALRTRVLHGWARALGVPGKDLSKAHVDALDALVTRWHGQGPVALPGGAVAARRAGVLGLVDPSPLAD
jgi:tRNA(Ile)-lysidine synthase